MSGRRTFAHTDPAHPASAGWTADVGPRVKLRDSDIERLADALGRALAAAEATRIERILTTAMRTPAAARAVASPGAPAPTTRQDVLRTLGALAAMTAQDAADALARIDPDTEAELDATAFQLHGRPASECPDRLPSIAHRALERMRKTRPGGGRPGRMFTRHIAAAAWALWRECGRDDVAVWHDGAGCSPLVTWCGALLHAADGGRRDHRQVADLLREARPPD